MTRDHRFSDEQDETLIGAPHDALSRPTPVETRPAAHSADAEDDLSTELEPARPPPQPHPPGPAIRRPPGPVRKPAKKRLLGLPRSCIWLMALLMTSFCGAITLLSGFGALVFLPRVEAEWTARIAEVDNYRGFQSTFIYDRHGELLYEAFGEGRRQRVDYARFPQSLMQATIAIEDDSFYSNIGIDIGATAIATLRYLGASAGELTAGGSTITQQLVRNIYFDFEKRARRSVARKVEEIALAIVLTQAKSKQEIMEMYLNEIYYGNLAYGAQTAAQTFFGKNVEALTLGESAMLAGLPQAPANLDPLNPDPAVQAAVDARWRQVLGEMREEGFISEAEVKDALSQGLAFVPANRSLTAPHFTVYASAELERLLTYLGFTPDDITRGGLRVYTTLDRAVNDLAQADAANHVAGLWNRNVSNGAVLALRPATGEIIAMVGSVDYDNAAIDGSVNVTTAFRQPGSAVKPFTYAAAMERGMSSGDALWDIRTEIEIPGSPPYMPRNYDGAFHGPMTMRTALANSYNIPAVQTLRAIGVETLLDMLRRFGISTLDADASQYGLSLTLGGGEITLIELTNAYAALANGGDYVPSTSIRCVLDSDEVILYQYENGCPSGRVNAATISRHASPTAVLDPRVAWLLTDMLSDNAARSPAMGAWSPLRLDGIAAAAKTGTTDDVKDNWTVGFTPDVALGVWVGNNDGAPMVNTSGLSGAAPIWKAALESIYDNPALHAAFSDGASLRRINPAPPPGMSLRQICDIRRLHDPATGCAATLDEWFLDSPAAIPDADGVLHYPLSTPATKAQPTSGSSLRQVSPGVYETLAFPLPPELAATIRFQTGVGEKQPLPPRYCRVPVEHTQTAMAAGARMQWFIAPPATSAADAIEAERYARERNLAYLPSIDCLPSFYSARTIGGVGAQLQITQPFDGQRVDGVIPIIGTAGFDGGQAEYYHLFIRGGRFADWTPLGHAHRQPVYNGHLETLHADALESGAYVLRLALLRAGAIVQAHDVVFVVP